MRGLAAPKGEGEVAQLDVLDEGNVVGATNRGFVIVLPRIDAEDVVLLHLAMFPPLWVRGLPAFAPPFSKSSLKTSGSSFLGSSADRDERARVERARI